MDTTRTTEATAAKTRPQPWAAPLWPAILAAWIGGAASLPPASPSPPQPAPIRPQA
ncbi:MAG TPA: hypothetical protein VGM87_13535 [Roseomonas sp.]|jgi:hypothetical protein